MKKIILAAGCLALFTSCATFKPALLEQNHITNATVGEKGYRVQIPEGFVYQPPEVTAQVQGTANVDTEIKSFYEKFPLKGDIAWAGDAFAFKEGSQAVFFTVAILNIPVGWTLLDENQTDQMLAEVVDMGYSHGLRSSRKLEIKGHRAIYSESYERDKSRFALSYFILGSENEIYAVLGSSPYGEAKSLKGKVKHVVDSLAF